MSIIRNSRYSESSVPSWLKWSLWILSLVLILVFIYSIYLYHTIEQSKLSGFAETKEKVLHETDLIVIDDINRFNGKNAFHILFGKTKDDQNKIVFFPLKNKNKDLTIIDESETIAKQSILNQWDTQCQGCKLIKIIPAMVNDEALWELTYIDKSKRYTIDYLSIYDGSRYEQFRFTRMFN